MAHKKGAGSSRNGRESHSKRLGIKIFGGQAAIAGNIIVRQRGTPHHPGKNVGIGKDHTLFALIDGTVLFKKKADNKSYVSVLPRETVAAEVIAPVQEKKVAVEAEIIEAPVNAKAASKKAEPEEKDEEIAAQEVEIEEAKAPAKKSAKKDVDAIEPITELSARNKAQTPSEEL